MALLLAVGARGLHVFARRSAFGLIAPVASEWLVARGVVAVNKVPLRCLLSS